MKRYEIALCAVLLALAVWALLGPRSAPPEAKSEAIVQVAATGAVLVETGSAPVAVQPSASPQPAAVAPTAEPAAAASAAPTGPASIAEQAPAATVPEPAPSVITPVPEVPPAALPELWPTRVLIGTGMVGTDQLTKDLERAIASNTWSNYREQLERSLLQSCERLPKGTPNDPCSGLWDLESWYVSLLRWRVLKLLPPALWQDGGEDKTKQELARHLFTTPKAMEEMLQTVTAEDDPMPILPAMLTYRRTHGDKKELAAKYFNLALACALVFDREVSLTNTNTTDSGKVDPENRYRWYTSRNEGGLLEVSVDRSPARDLVFVVCAPVDEEELDWALRKYRSLGRKAWGKTFGEIEYLMERAVEGLNPYSSYTLEQIHKHGGICGDQTYFCVNTARAAGIPALGLSGVTDSGGHAWAAVKLEEDVWSTQIGRIKGVSQGRTVDPQSGATITEQDIWQWSERSARGEATPLKVHRHLWFADLLALAGLRERQTQVITAALRIGRNDPLLWQKMYELIREDPEIVKQPKAPQTLERWQQFCADVRRQFADNPRMAALAIQIEEERLFEHMELPDIRRNLARERRRQSSNAGEQTDLLTTSLKREANWVLKKEKEPEVAMREICQLYDDGLREYGASITGFENMANDYFAFVQKDEKLAKKAVRDMELAFQRVVESGSQDWFRAKTELGLYRRIAAFYREVGEEKRAASMERRLELQLEKAKKKAL